MARMDGILWHFPFPVMRCGLFLLLREEREGDPVGFVSSVDWAGSDPDRTSVGSGMSAAHLMRFWSAASTIIVSPSGSRDLLVRLDFGRGGHCVSSLVPPPANSGPLPFSGNSEFRAMESPGCSHRQSRIEGKNFLFCKYGSLVVLTLPQHGRLSFLKQHAGYIWRRSRRVLMVLVSRRSEVASPGLEVGRACRKPRQQRHWDRESQQ